MLQNSAPHTEISHILENNPSLLRSSFCHDTLMDNQTLTDVETMLQRKKKNTPQLLIALDKEDYMTIARLWEPQFSEPKGVWRKLSFCAQKGAHMEKKWAPIRRAILEGEHQYLRSHWIEKEFGPIARKEGLAQQTQESIRPIYKNSYFPKTAHWPLAYITHSLLHVVFPWPYGTPRIPLCIIAWHSKHYPRSISDVEETSLAHHTHHNNKFLHHVILPCKKDEAFISIWPAAFVAETIIPVQAPLHVQSATSAHLMYETRIQRKRAEDILHVKVRSPVALRNIKLSICSAPLRAPLQEEVIEEYTVSAMQPSQSITLKTKVTSTPQVLFSLKGVLSHGECLPTYQEARS